ncbi:DciA family protein [Piscinibacter sp.]|uniref:DciA family protein n=1 Tax=Piscinibacter sp. TaxID=1903157 RepID=UPI0035B27DDF
MSSKPPPLVPDSMTVSEALRRSAPLTQLRARLQESADRFEAIRGALPGALARHVRPGPIDEEGWSLLVANAAVAAKLRQIKPHLEGLLREQGWQVSSIRIRVQSN